MKILRRLATALQRGLAVGAVSLPLALAAAAPGEEVAVVYNRNGGPESLFVAEHYARARQVPKDHLIGLRLPNQETISRTAFEKDLLEPLLSELKQRRLLTIQGVLVPAQPGQPGRVVEVIQAARIRYLVLCYGMPLRINPDPKHVDPGQDQMPEPLRRNEAAVDSELAFVAQRLQGAPLAGAGRNPHHATTNPSTMTPPNGILMVARLDGPTPEIARALVDQAINAEQSGLWGRAWFDVRGLKSGEYKVGDDWIRAAAEVAKQAGFETFVDERPGVFPEGFPLPQIALYAGWYAGAVSGPFAAPKVEFMPGAVAYHLHSYSATTVRSDRARWVGPLLARGVTATMGCVFEPYLGLTPDVGIFFDRLVAKGFTFGEAAYAAQQGLSWQTTVVGDPLYRPFGRSLAERLAEMEATNDSNLPWARLQAMTVRLGPEASAEDTLAQLERLPGLKSSAVLQQRLAELQAAAGHVAEAVYAYRRAIDLDASPEQRVHLQLALARLLAGAKREAEALEVFETFFREQPQRPGLLPLYREALRVAQRAGAEEIAARYSQEIERLTPPPAEPKNGASTDKP